MQDLFSKLRFSYIEQVTKEKFLRAVASTPPLLIDPADNAELEQRLAERKAALKQQKADVASQIEQLAGRAKELVARYEALHAQREELQTLPAQVDALEREVEGLRESEEAEGRHAERIGSREPHLNLPLDQTLEILSAREDENAALDAEIESLQGQIPQRSSELEKLERDLKPLEAQKLDAVTAARDARKRREDGVMDDLEARGRWLSACERGLGAWLEVES